MIRLSASVCIDAAPERVWEALARLEDIRHWSEAVLDARCEGNLSRGLGAERTCELRGGITIRERWVAWEEGCSFTYEGAGIPLVAHARNRWSVWPESGNRTLLVSDAELVLKGGVAARLLEPILAFQIKRLTPRTLAAFRHLVEHGAPPAIKHARLPRIRVAC